MNPIELLSEPRRLPLAAARIARALLEGGPEGLRRWMERGSHLGQAVPYSEWVLRHDRQDAAAIAAWETRAAALHEKTGGKPLLSLALRSGRDAAQFARALSAVQHQAWPRWELLVLLEEGAPAELREQVRRAAAEDPRVQETLAPAACPFAPAQRMAGEMVALLDPEAELSPHALLLAVEELQAWPRAALIFADHDHLDEDGRRADPFFKPELDRSLLWSTDYLSPFCLVRRETLRAVQLPEGPASAARYAAHLAALRPAPRDGAVHLPAVLCHLRREGPRGDAAAEDLALQRVLQAELDQVLAGAVVEPGLLPHTRHVRPPLPPALPQVTAIVPTRDGVRVLRRLIEGLLGQTEWPQLELLVVDNDSRDPETLQYLSELAATGKARVLHHSGPFNYSAINNRAALAAQGEVLVLLNDDLEVTRPDWLRELVAHALRPEVGAVGALLRYPDGRIQHAGIATGVLGLAGHVMRGLPRDAPGPNGLARVVRGCSAVTAACFAIRRELFLRHGGFDERLAVAFNDVDLCLRLCATGLTNVFTPYAELIHHESFSRGSDQTAEKRERFAGEMLTMLLRWPHLDRDPLYNPNLSLATEQLEPGSPPRSP